ncbi:MAG: Maf family nucleotide pyrophosphatase [Hydrogenophilus sp.]|nr:Maf family nucleotide pyrophosphatase [Hydrogenophilus sp.]
MLPLILASTSPYRRALLSRLGLSFQAIAPEIDETPLEGETPEAQAARLALAKARAVVQRLSYPALVLGSDQVAAVGSTRFGKPTSPQRAVAQLQHLRGKRVEFYTAVALIDPIAEQTHLDTIVTRVYIRADLSDAEIERYVARDQPLDCAGAAKIESLGITLVDAVETSDPTALEGLPLITVSRWLRRAGFLLP